VAALHPEELGQRVFGEPGKTHHSQARKGSKCNEQGASAPEVSVVQLVFKRRKNVGVLPHVLLFNWSPTGHHTLVQM
jgi:hypothetical protein